MIPSQQITGLVLAGGRATRMRQVQKGLQLLQNEPMLSHVLRRLQAQVGAIIINANQDLELYSAYAYPVVSDEVKNFAGPLAGLHAGLLRCETPYLLCVPCDSPFLPNNLVEKLAQALIENQVQLAVVCAPNEESEAATNLESKSEHSTMRAQPVFALMESGLASHLHAFLENGGRKITAWYASLRVTEVAFVDAASFRNINTLEELQHYNQFFAD